MYPTSDYHAVALRDRLFAQTLIKTRAFRLAGERDGARAIASAVFPGGIILDRTLTRQGRNSAVNRQKPDPTRAKQIAPWRRDGAGRWSPDPALRETAGARRIFLVLTACCRLPTARSLAGERGAKAIASRFFVNQLPVTRSSMILSESQSRRRRTGAEPQVKHAA